MKKVGPRASPLKGRFRLWGKAGANSDLDGIEDFHKNCPKSPCCEGVMGCRETLPRSSGNMQCFLCENAWFYTPR